MQTDKAPLKRQKPDTQCPKAEKMLLDASSSSLESVLGGSWDLVSKVISTLSGIISSYEYSYLNYNPNY